MAHGSPTDPDKIDAALRELARTGNVRGAARAAGLAESTLRSALGPEKIAQARAAYAHARDAKIREGCRAVGAGLGLTRRLLRAESADGPGLEPRDIAALMNASSRATDTLLSARADEDRRHQARLTRERTRAEIELLHARLNGTLPEQGAGHTTINVHDAEAVERRIQELLKAVGPAAPRAAGPPGGEAPPD